MGNKRILAPPGHPFYSKFVVVFHSAHFLRELELRKEVMAIG
jgi:hypothetical protein